MSSVRLDFELDHALKTSSCTAHGGVLLLIEYSRSGGAAAIVDAQAELKCRVRALSASEIIQSLLALWACSSEPVEDLDRLPRGAPGLSLLLASGQRGLVHQGSTALSGLWRVNRATLDVSTLRPGLGQAGRQATYDGRCGYQPTMAL